MAESSVNKASVSDGCKQAKELNRRKPDRQNKAFHPVRTLFLTVILSVLIPVLLITCFFPVLRIYGGSMEPTLNEGEIVIGLKGTDPECGQLCAFRYGTDRILVKRVIAVSGDTVDMDDDGNVYVNGELLEEPYVTDKSAGESDVSFPMTVPEGTYFVMGDHRGTSLDSRSSDMGCIQENDMIGKVIFRIWPLSRFGFAG